MNNLDELEECNECINDNDSNKKCNRSSCNLIIIGIVILLIAIYFFVCKRK